MRPTIILLVEDEPVIALDVRYRLEREGHRVLCADQLDDDSKRLITASGFPGYIGCCKKNHLALFRCFSLTLEQR